MRVLVVMDPIESVNLKKDSTMAMLWAAARRGHELGYALQQDLYIDQGKAFGLISPLKVFEDYNHYYELGDIVRFNMNRLVSSVSLRHGTGQ